MEPPKSPIDPSKLPQIREQLNSEEVRKRIGELLKNGNSEQAAELVMNTLTANLSEDDPYRTANERIGFLLKQEREAVERIEQMKAMFKGAGDLTHHVFMGANQKQIYKNVSFLWTRLFLAGHHELIKEWFDYCDSQKNQPSDDE